MQKAAEDVVRSEYARAGFSFPGWGACEPGSPGIRIRIADVADRHVQAFGARLDGMSDGMQLNLSFTVPFYGCNGTGVKNCVEEDALHEFGHALGLRHEQSRVDSFCADDGTVGLGEGGALRLTAYDKDSIMNYCANGVHFVVGGRRAQLSDGDVETLRSYYAVDPSAGRAACEADGLSWVEDDLGSCCEGATQSQLAPFNSKPYHACWRRYQLSLPQLDDASLEEFLGDSYEPMKTSDEVDVPWLNVEIACRYGEQRKFSWKSYLLGEELREFLRSKTFSFWMKPSSDLVCDGLSFERSNTLSWYLKGSTGFQPNLDQSTPIEGSLKSSLSPVYDNFLTKYIDIQLPTLPFTPRSVLLTCDRGSYMGYAYGDGGLMWVGVSFNANYFKKETLHCTGLEAFDQELPHDAGQTRKFLNFSYDLLLDTEYPTIYVD